MKLANFFEKAPYAQPVNPDPVDFTLVAKGPVLPGGHANPSKRAVKAKCRACFIFLDGDELAKITREAKKHLNEMKDEQGVPIPWGEDELAGESMYRELFQAVRDYDEKNKEAGEIFFESLNVIRKTLQPRERNRVYKLWVSYLDREHSSKGAATGPFRGTEGGSEGVAAQPSG